MTDRFETARHLFLLFLGAVGLLAVSGCSSGEPQDLRGPDPQVGDVYRSEMKMTLKDGKMTATGGGASESGQLEMSYDGVYEDLTLAVKDGRETKVRTRVVSEQTVIRAQVSGQPENHTEHSSLEGETIEFEKVGAAWKNKLVGKVPKPQQELDLKDFPPPPAPADTLPAGRVKPGFSWEVDVKSLPRLIGGTSQVGTGKWKRTFEKVIQLQGQSCTQIADEIELQGRMQGDKGEWMKLELKARGTTHFSLKNTFGERTWKGNITLSGTVLEGGQKIAITITGPVTLTGKWKRL